MSPTSTPHYLLIDDHETFAQLLMRGFARHELSLDWCPSGEKALQSSMQYDGIILDLNLGEESGLHLLPLLKQKFPDSAIVVLTGYASISTAVKAIKLGATHYLPKPASVSAILQAFQGEGETEIEENEDFESPSLKRLTWEHIQLTLDAHQGNISATARALGLHRRSLQRMLAKHPKK